MSFGQLALCSYEKDIFALHSVIITEMTLHQAFLERSKEKSYGDRREREAFS